MSRICRSLDIEHPVLDRVGYGFMSTNFCTTIAHTYEAKVYLLVWNRTGRWVERSFWEDIPGHTPSPYEAFTDEDFED